MHSINVHSCVRILFFQSRCKQRKTLQFAQCFVLPSSKSSREDPTCSDSEKSIVPSGMVHLTALWEIGNQHALKRHNIPVNYISLKGGYSCCVHVDVAKNNERIILRDMMQRTLRLLFCFFGFPPSTATW